VKDDSEVSELMEVFVDDTAYNSKFPKTSAGKRRYKETEKGLDIMCEIMEKLTTEAMDEGIAKGKAEGKAEGTLELLYNLVQDGVLTLTDAAKRANMTEVIFTEKTQQFKA
jgi:flagellar biosynthesis/type III secretory pathway protein FliH